MPTSRLGPGVKGILESTTLPTASEQPTKAPRERARKDKATPTTPAPARTPATNKGGRPRTLPENMTRIPVELPTDQVIWLDRLALTMRSRSGRAVKRAPVIRAMLAAVAASGIDLSHVTSEEEITQLLLAKLKK